MKECHLLSNKLPNTEEKCKASYEQRKPTKGIKGELRARSQYCSVSLLALGLCLI